VRSARLFCEEKGVDYTLEAADLGSDAYRAIHPFGKIPAMKHGDRVVYETAAIGRYLDEAFDGPPLQPTDPGDRASMEQWISAYNDYLYQTIVIGWIVTQLRGGEVDEAATADVKARLEVLDRALAATGRLAGSDATLADLMVVPMLAYLSALPSGQALLADLPNAKALLDAAMARPSFAATQPPPPAEEAAD